MRRDLAQFPQYGVPWSHCMSMSANCGQMRHGADVPLFSFGCRCCTLWICQAPRPLWLTTSFLFPCCGRMASWLKGLLLIATAQICFSFTHAFFKWNYCARGLRNACEKKSSPELVQADAAKPFQEASGEVAARFGTSGQPWNPLQLVLDHPCSRVSQSSGRGSRALNAPLPSPPIPPSGSSFAADPGTVAGTDERLSRTHHGVKAEFSPIGDNSASHSSKAVYPNCSQPRDT